MFRLSLIICLYMVFLLGLNALACNVPVYRYALQYWRQNPYLVRCFYKKSLHESDRQLLQHLEECSLSGHSSFNFILETVDLSIPDSEGLFPSDLPGDTWPYLIVYYPGQDTVKIAWHGPVDFTLPDRIVESPLRYAIAEKLSAGHTAVWLFLKSGNSEMDSEKLSLLQRELKRLQTELKFPDQSQTVLYSSSMDSDDQSALTIEFSSLILSRTDPQEEILLAMLMNSESDLDEYESLPMVFPVYGRGRILYALVGDGITPENIRKTAEFFIAPCTCILKDTHTGTDLLMTTDWSAATGTIDSQPVDHRSLSGFSDFIQNDLITQPMQPERNETQENLEITRFQGNIRSRIILSILIIPVGILLLACAIIVKRRI